MSAKRQEADREVEAETLVSFKTTYIFPIIQAAHRPGYEYALPFLLNG